MARIRGEKLICTIRWCVDDLRQGLVDAGFKDTDENVRKVIDQNIEGKLRDISVEYGWQFMDTILSCMDDLEEEEEDLEDGRNE